HVGPAVDQVDIADVLLCGPIHDHRAGVAVQAAPERDRNALARHQHRSQLVEGRTKAGSHRPAPCASAMISSSVSARSHTVRSATSPPKLLIQNACDPSVSHGPIKNGRTFTLLPSP